MSAIRRLYPQEMLKISQAVPHQEAISTWDQEPMPSVTIVILSLDRLYLTRRCVESVYAHSDYPFDLLIWDNGSQPETLAYLQAVEATHDNLTVTYHPTNLGAAMGRNRAFAEVDTDYVLALDNDTICHSGWLREMMACALRHEAEFVAPMRLDTTGLVWSLAEELVRTQDDSVLEIARWFHDLPVEMVQRLFRGADLTTNFLSTCTALFAVDAFRECGGFPGFSRAGFEDIDFSLRLAERGYTVWVTPQAMITHDDEWSAQSEADEAYAKTRYDMEALKQNAARFKSTWGVEVLPEKYVRAFETRLQRKLGSTE